MNSDLYINSHSSQYDLSNPFNSEQENQLISTLKEKASKLLSCAVDSLGGKVWDIDRKTTLIEIDDVISTLTQAKLLFQNNCKVTLEVVRETFYNAIYQGLTNDKEQLITKENIDCDDDFIFQGLSALSIITVIQYSTSVNGLKLYNNEVLSNENCPDEFKSLIEKVLSCKERILKIINNETDFKNLKILAVKNPKKSLPEDYANKKEITTMAAVIYEVAIRITQKEKFKQIAQNVFEVCSVFASD